MEWTTQSDEGQQAGDFGNGNGHDTQPLPPQPPLPPQSHPPLAPQPHPPLPEESVTPPVTSPPPPIPTHHAAPMPSATPQAPSGFEQCPSCGALAAADQRYCLECGHRRGEPRLPFMDAVVFMDAMNQPPEAASASTKTKKRGVSPNAALIAGVGTLLLALGIGVLIGRSGHGSAPAAAAPQVVTVAGGGETTTSSTGGETTGGGASAAGKPKKQVVKAKKQAAESGEGAKEVLHYSSKAKPPAKSTAQLGETCEKGSAGCGKTGKFEGEFFGE